MDWQSSRGSRRHRIQKDPGDRNPFALIAMVIVLMVGAVALGYLISQVVLPAFVSITPPQGYSSVSSGVASSAVSSLPTVSGSATTFSEPSSSSAASESPPEATESASVSLPESTTDDVPAVAEGFGLPAVSYYRVQVISAANQEGAQQLLDEMIEANYVAEIVPKGENFSVQVGIFGLREQAQELADSLTEQGYEGPWVTSWSIEAGTSTEQRQLREAQASPVRDLAEAVQAVLNGETPAAPTVSLPEGTSDDERQEWDVALSALRVWINDPSARRPSHILKLIEALQSIYAWF